MRGLIFLALCLALPATAQSNKEQQLTEFKTTYAAYEALYEQGDWHETAERAYEALNQANALFDTKGKNIAALQYNYGFALKQAGVRSASKELNKAVTLYEHAYGKNAPELVQVLIDYGNSYTNRETVREKEISEVAERLRKLVRKLYEKDSEEYGRQMIEVGSLYLKGGLSNKARRRLEEGHRILQRQLGDSSPYTAFGAFQLGKWALTRKKYQQAIDYLEQSLPVFQLAGQANTDLELATHARLVHAYEKLGRREAATKHCLAVGRMTPFQDSENLKPIFKVLAKYPRVTRHKAGKVMLHFDVDAIGMVRNIQVGEHTGGEAFVASAKEALKQYRYAPAFREGHAVETQNVRSQFSFVSGSDNKDEL